MEESICTPGCTDAALPMLSCNLGFPALAKQLVLTSKSVHCMLHRQTLASKTSSDSIQTVLEQIILISNFIKAESLNSMLLKGCVTTWIQTTWCFSTVLKLDDLPKEM